jgi:hypothetical protein
MNKQRSLANDLTQNNAKLACYFQSHSNKVETLDKNQVYAINLTTNLSK